MIYGDIRDILMGLPYPPYDGTAYALEDLFTVRHNIIRQLDPPPTGVFEFGALLGFFLVTALDAAPGITKVGWIDNESHTPGSNHQCMANVSSLWEMPTRGCLIAGEDRALVDQMTSGDHWQEPHVDGGFQFDLVQVDGDHSYAGCHADLHAAVKLQPRWIFVDDWTSTMWQDDIHQAVEDFEAAHPGEWLRSEHETANGLLVLTRA